MGAKIDKEQRVIDLIKNVVAYVKKEEKTIGIYNTTEDMRKSNINKNVRELIRAYGYNIQMVIK